VGGRPRRVIRVNFYSGYREEETPLSFEIDGRIHTVVEVIERKIVEDFYSRQRRRLFVVKTDENVIYEIEENGGWSLTRRAGSQFA
jgi:hypothetical protein